MTDETPPIIPADFARKMTRMFGDRAVSWLERLPGLLADCARRWSLALLPPFPDLSINYVAPAVRADGTEAVLKAGVPHPELWTEMAALRVFDGRSVVRLLEADDEAGVFLLERLRPGTTLTTLADAENDARATSIAAEVMCGLWRPVPAEHTFPSLADWARGLERLRARFGGPGPFPPRLLEEAEALFGDLLASTPEQLLIHGDMHHDNILAADSSRANCLVQKRQPWLAIDPKGILGDPAYDAAWLLGSLWPDRHAIADPQRMLERRFHQLAEELAMDRARLRGWAVAQHVLSAWWCIEDNSNCFHDAIATAGRLSALRA